jgi:threonyl-tRNA synthetase
MRTGNIGAFRLTHVASAYYKGDERNPQLQRIYGTAFKNKTELEAYFTMLEEAKKRDHRKLGRELELFTFDEDVGPGLPLWLPNGTVLLEELERLAKETEFAAGYQRVRTPHLARENMYLTSGHLPYYAESMFPPLELAEKAADGSPGEVSDRYYLKAMNCPHHHKIFKAVPHSYRDLPLRLAEYGTCYRYEQSGELLGLMRVRSMQMNDAHIYCTPEQFEAEFRAVNDMYLKYFKIFGFEKYLMRFSTHDPARLGEKFVDDPELWKQTENMVRGVLQRSGIEYVEVPNEAAFYGPKIDVQVWSAIGREFTIATNQVDFAVPSRFGLVYKDRDNTEKTPLCIHRAPLGTHERFVGFLIEHYAGNFPLWLAPEQVRILPIGAEPDLVEAGAALRAELRAHGVRAEMDASTDKINGKVLHAEEAKVHTMLVLGRRDLEAGALSVRVHGKGNLGAKPRAEVIADIVESIRERRAH